MSITQERRSELAILFASSKPGTCIPVSKEELAWIDSVTLFQPNGFNKFIQTKEITDEQPWY